MAETSFDAVAGALNSKLTWQLLGLLSDNTTKLTIPSGCNEIMCRYVQSLRNNRALITHILPITYINDSPYGTVSVANSLCAFVDNGSVKGFVIKCSATEIRLNEYTGAGDAGAAVQFWYR